MKTLENKCQNGNKVLELYRYTNDKQEKMSNKKGFFLRLDNYESNKKKLEDNQKIDAEVIALKTKIETANGDIRQTSTYVLIIQNVNTGQELIKEAELDRYTAEVMREGIGTIVTNDKQEFIFKSITLKIDKKVEPSNVVMSKVLSKMYKSNTLN